MSFILGMTLHPEFQKKAQTEIDKVIGDQRLPTLADRPNLPYVNCIVKEVLRLDAFHFRIEWQSYLFYSPCEVGILPVLWVSILDCHPMEGEFIYIYGHLGSPRRVMEDDVYEGMLIPSEHPYQ